MTAKKPKTRDDVVLVEIDDEVLVYDPESEGVDYLNASAKLVFQLCDGDGDTGPDCVPDRGSSRGTDRNGAKRRASGCAAARRPQPARALDRSHRAPAASADGEPAERKPPICLDVRPGPCTEKVDRLAWTEEQSYEFGPYQLGVRTNSERFGAWLEDTLSQYRRSEIIGSLYSVLIPEAGSRQREKFNVLYRESLVLARTLDVAELVRTLRFELESFLFAEWDEAIVMESAVVSTGGACALVPSLTASELSRDRKRAERAGLSAPPGGRMAIDPDLGRLVPIPSQLRVLEDAIGELVGVESSQVPATSADDELPTFDVVCLPSLLTELSSSRSRVPPPCTCS